MNISMNEIEKGIIRKTHSNSYTTNSSDVYISVIPKTKKRSTTVRFNYHFKWFKNFKFVTFSRVGNVLFFKLSNKNPDGTAYAISEKGRSEIFVNCGIRRKCRCTCGFCRTLQFQGI